MKDFKQASSCIYFEKFSMKHPVFATDFWHLYNTAKSWAETNDKDTSYDDWCVIEGDEECITIKIQS